MAGLLILGTSILLQLTAAILALRLIRVTGKLGAWGLIALAILFTWLLQAQGIGLGPLPTALLAACQT